VLPQAHGYIRGSSSRILVDDRASAAPVPYDREVFQERQYYLPLHKVLVQSKELSQDRLVSFVRTASIIFMGVAHMFRKIETTPNHLLQRTGEQRCFLAQWSSRRSWWCCPRR
jgi:hypothetical protein